VPGPQALLPRGRLYCCGGAGAPSSVFKAPDETQGPTVLKPNTTPAAVTCGPAAPEQREGA
jgi:hypothetical protein